MRHLYRLDARSTEAVVLSSAGLFRGVASSKSVGWTTGRASIGGLEVESPEGSRAPGLVRGSNSLKQKACWCLYIHRSGHISPILGMWRKTLYYSHLCYIWGGPECPLAKVGWTFPPPFLPVATPLGLFHSVLSQPSAVDSHRDLVLCANTAETLTAYRDRHAPCGLRGCKTRPAPFPGRMS